MSGAQVGVGVRRGVVAIEVEQPIVRVAVIVAADIRRVNAAVGVHAVKQNNPAHYGADNPKANYSVW